MHDSQVSLFRSAIGDMCQSIDLSGRSEELSAIGFVTCDRLDQVGAFLLFNGDLPETAETFRKLSPVEWRESHEASFADLNDFLQASLADDGVGSDLQYEERVKDVYAACAEALDTLCLRRRYCESLYVTFSGTDPNDVLVGAEKEFVRRMNNSQIFEEWCREIE